MFDVDIPHPEIMIFKSGLDNPEEIIKYSEAQNAWSEWFTFGKNMDLYKNFETFESFPNKNDWNEKILKNPIDPCVKKITDYFYETTKIYFEKYNLNDEKINFQNINIARYDEDKSIYEDYAMNHHTDWQQARKDFPGYFFYITCLFYLNDDYDDGQIIFRKLNHDQSKIEYSLDYKPNAGDIVIFPSTPPFYHAVRSNKNGKKYFIRTYWRKWQNPDKFWNEGVEKYGAEKWEQMQEEESKKMSESSFMIKENEKDFYFQGLRNIMEDSHRWS